MILAVAFLIYFQKNPIYTVIIIGLGFGVYFFVKSRKKGGSGGLFFGSRTYEQQQESFNTAFSLIMLQQLLNEDRAEESELDELDRQKEAELEKRKQEISNIIKGSR